MTLLKDIQQIPSSQKHLREFGLTVGGVFLALGLLFLWKEKPYALAVIVVSLGLIGTGFLVPSALKPIQIAWMSLALCLGWVMSRVILCAVFYLVMTPIGFILKATGRGFEAQKRGASGSDWVARSRKGMNYKNQF